ncbi:hypothetical protein [Phenylobacterium ferrooxidans]|uniref:Uncharacterized protein n=1 Tax=Phenylobacterium ferrooxidans TaxID=2982689 RepID=A0ABW6CIR3_9CAUL
MDFVGLAAALAFIAVSPSAAAVTEKSADQFRQDAFSAAASPASSSIAADAGNAGSFRLAQSTECANPSDSDCNGEEDDSSTNSGEDNQFDAFHFEYLPSDQNILEQWYDFQNEVYVDNIPNHWGPPYANGLRTRMYGPGAPSAGCLGRGGAIMFSVKARALGCWRPAKAAPVRGLKVPALGPAAQRVLTNCRFSTGSVTLRKGAFACIATPRAVVRKAAKGAKGRASLGWPWLG